MVQAWWAAGLTIPAVIVKGFLGGRNKGRKEDELRAMYVICRSHLLLLGSLLQSLRARPLHVVHALATVIGKLSVLSRSAGQRRVQTQALCARECAHRIGCCDAWGGCPKILLQTPV